MSSRSKPDSRSSPKSIPRRSILKEPGVEGVITTTFAKLGRKVHFSNDAHPDGLTYRRYEEYSRGSPTYVLGKHAHPEGHAWIDTSGYIDDQGLIEANLAANNIEVDDKRCHNENTNKETAGNATPDEVAAQPAQVPIHQCPLCDARFNVYEQLENHVNRIHRAPEPEADEYFVAPGAPGPNEGDLNDYTYGTVIESFTPLRCQYCTSSYFSHADLNVHVATVHADSDGEY